MKIPLADCGGVSRWRVRGQGSGGAVGVV